MGAGLEECVDAVGEDAVAAQSQQEDSSDLVRLDGADGCRGEGDCWRMLDGRMGRTCEMTGCR